MDSDSLTVSITTLPTKGTVTNNGNGTFTYIAAVNQVGSDAFAFSVTDSKPGTTPATATVAVSLKNAVPIPNNERYNASPNQQIHGTLSASDSDNDALSFSIVSGSDHGTITRTDAVFTYTPDHNYTGNDTIVFAVSDGIAHATGTITIEINCSHCGSPLNGPWEAVTSLPSLGGGGPVEQYQEIESDFPSYIMMRYVTVVKEYRLAEGVAYIDAPAGAALSGGWITTYSTANAISIGGSASGGSRTVTGSYTRTWTTTTGTTGNVYLEALPCFQLEARPYDEVLVKIEVLVRVPKPGYSADPNPVSGRSESVIGYTGRSSFMIYKQRVH